MANEETSQSSSTSNNTNQSSSSPKHHQIKFDTGPILLDTEFHGVLMDFNLGARIQVPKDEKIRVKITNADNDLILFDQVLSDSVVSVEKKFYVRYRIELWSEDNKEHFKYELNLKDQVVYIKFPTTVLGDTLAWFPYAEEFRKKHQCKLYVRVSKAIAELISGNYPEITFVTTEEDVRPDRCLATYYMGIFFPTSDRAFQPVDFRYVGLHKAAAYILGVSPEERKVKIKVGPRFIKERYVCIAAQSTTQCKYWNNPVGWMETVSYLKKLGYRVLCIDKDKVYGITSHWNYIPYGSEDFTGNIPLSERASMLAHADFFIGLSSGLSWLAWNVGCPVVMISGFTLPMNEFYTPYRVINYQGCNGCWQYEEFKHDDFMWCPRHSGTNREFECTKLITHGAVINKINQLMNDFNLTPPNQDKS